MEPIDVIILSHNRLHFLVRTVEALFARTPEPIRVTVVDNASGPEVRNWLAAHRERFERLILRPTNEHVSAFQHGIEATTSDPFVVTDPDLVVPDISPSWLARLLATMERHSDFGLIGVDLDEASRSPALRPDEVSALTALRGETRRVDDELHEGLVGTCFQLIKRDALREPYMSDSRACRSVRRAGYRTGWNPTVRAHHLGAYDYDVYPGHVLEKSEAPGFLDFRILLDAAPCPPTLAELALAGPVIARTRAARIPDSSVLELAWDSPAIAAALDGPIALVDPPVPIPLDACAAGAVVLLNPPGDRMPALLGEAFRIATRLVVALAPLEAVEGRLADELAPVGWRGMEEPAIGDFALALASTSSALSGSERLDLTTREHREGWLRFFAAGTFGPAERRLFVFEADDGEETPAAVRYDPSVVTPWRPERPPPGANEERRRREAIERALFALRDRPSRSRRLSRRARRMLARTASFRGSRR